MQNKKIDREARIKKFAEKMNASRPHGKYAFGPISSHDIKDYAKAFKAAKDRAEKNNS